MSDQTSQTVPPEVLHRLIEAVQSINAITLRLAQVAPWRAVTGGGDAATGAAVPMLVPTPSQRAICERVVNVFETGTVRGRYGAISIYADGPHRIRQITYGRSQTTEYGNLRTLIDRYVAAGGIYSDSLRPFVPLIGRTALVDNATFKDLLRRAGDEDPVMERMQDAFFSDTYFDPAMHWAGRNGFTHALSALVIYDSFIHSGGIFDFLRARFPELTPARGGQEQAWIKRYAEVRHAWLSNHEQPDIRASAYRTRDLLREIARGNWDLAQMPIVANGTPVDDGGIGHGASAAAPAGADDVPYLGDGPSGSADAPWCEGGSDGEGHLAAGVSSVASSLAQQILADRRISLATTHVSRRLDQATAQQNIVDTAAGRQAQRSAYDGAPGGTVSLDVGMLAGVLALAQEFTLSVSEFCGGAHSPNSRHYTGVTADINVINGERVRPGHPDVPTFMMRCRALGATEVLGPGFPGHDNHVHAAWPRPA